MKFPSKNFKVMKKSRFCISSETRFQYRVVFKQIYIYIYIYIYIHCIYTIIGVWCNYGGGDGMLCRIVCAA